MNKARAVGSSRSAQYLPSKEVMYTPSPLCSTLPKPDAAVKPNPVKAKVGPIGTIDFRKMVEQAAAISEHIFKGGKPDELSGIKFFNPAGVFDSRK